MKTIKIAGIVGGSFVALIVVLLVVMAIAGNQLTDTPDDEPASATTSTSPSADPSSESTPSAAPTATETTAPARDIEAAIRAEAGTDAEPMVSAEETESGRVVVETDLVDPRTESSVEALRALALCEAVARVHGVDNVTVREEDGTAWILYGHPSVTAGSCAEV